MDPNTVPEQQTRRERVVLDGPPVSDPPYAPGTVHGRHSGIRPDAIDVTTLYVRENHSATKGRVGGAHRAPERVDTAHTSRRMYRAPGSRVGRILGCLPWVRHTDRTIDRALAQHGPGLDALLAAALGGAR